MSIKEELDKIKIPIQNHDIYGLIEDEKDKTKAIFNDLWLMFIEEGENLEFRKFQIAYEKDKQEILKKYISIF